MPATLALREALNESISSGRFEDTKVILYSRRDTSGNICGPRALYASSHALKTVPYFNDRESLNTRPSRIAVNNGLRVLSGTFAEAESKDFSEAIDDSEITEDYGYYSDSDLEDDDHVVDSAEPPETVACPREQPLDPSSSSPRNDNSPRAYDELRKCSRQGKIIKVQDVSFITCDFSEQLHHYDANNLTDFRLFYSTYTPIKLSSHLTALRRSAGLEQRRSFPSQRIRSPGHRLNLSIDLRIRFLPSSYSGRVYK